MGACGCIGTEAETCGAEMGSAEMGDAVVGGAAIGETLLVALLYGRQCLMAGAEVEKLQCMKTFWCPAE